MLSDNLIKKLKIEQKKVLNKNLEYKCIKQWKYDHFDINDNITITKFEICEKPFFSDQDDTYGFEISFKIKNKDNGLTNKYFTFNDWINFNNCIRCIE